MFKNKNLFFLGTGIFLSTIGTFVMLLALSAEILVSTGSNVMASGVFAVQWIIPFVLAYPLSSLGARFNSKSILIGSEVAGVLTSLAISLLVGQQLWIPILCVLAVRGIHDGLCKSARVTYIKSNFDPSSVAAANSAVSTIYFLGIGAGSLAASFLVLRLSLFEIALVDAFTFLLSTLCFSVLKLSHAKEKPEVIKTSFMAFIGILKASNAFSFYILFSATVFIFQAFHQVMRTYIPISRFALNKDAVAHLQLSSIIGVIMGAMAVTYWTRKKHRLITNGKSWMWAAFFALLLVSFIPDWKRLLAFYCFFMILFEIAFLIFQNKMIVAIPEAALKKTSFWIQSSVTMWMCVAVITQSVVLDVFGYAGLIGVLSFAFLVIACGIKEDS